MNVYIVFSHPNHNGLGYAALQAAKKGFEDAGHEVRVTDLYQEQGFDPVLRYEDPHTLNQMQNDPATKTYRNAISWADRLVFIYPIWWGSGPALFKGFIDVVFASGFAYNFKGIWPHGHLGGKSAWVIVTHDTPWFIARFIQRDYGRIMRGQILRTMFGIKGARLTALPFLKRSTLKQRQKMLAKIYRIANQV